jgi:hypothetical protein
MVKTIDDSKKQMPTQIVGRELYQLCEWAHVYFNGLKAQLHQARLELNARAVAHYLASEDNDDQEEEVVGLAQNVLLLEAAKAGLEPFYNIWTTWGCPECEADYDRCDAALSTADPAVLVVQQAWLVDLAERQRKRAGATHKTETDAVASGARWATWAQWDEEFSQFLTEHMGNLEFDRHQAIWSGKDEETQRLTQEIDGLRPVYIQSYRERQYIGPADFNLPAPDNAVPLGCDITSAWEAFLSDATGARAAWERFLEAERGKL